MNKVCLLLLVSVTVTLQQPPGPVITTNNGNLNIASNGNITFQAGEGGEIQFMGPQGENMIVGEKGMKGTKGDTGEKGSLGVTGDDGIPGAGGFPGRTGLQGVLGTPGSQGIKGDIGSVGPAGDRGQQGVRGVSATDSSLVTWNECAWLDLNSGVDYGEIATCTLNKARNDTWLKITWSGNMRITRCVRCCMKWYFTINGEECSEPGSIGAVTFQSQNYHLLRHSTITGSCRSTVDYSGKTTDIPDGPIRIQFLVSECRGFNNVYDVYTGWNSVSRITIEEIIPRDITFPEISAMAPADFVYTPSYCQYVFPNLGDNRERNVGTVTTRKFTKDHPHTVLRVTWEGNFRKTGCTDCCTKWWVEIDGSPCSNYEDLATSIRSSDAQDIFAPTTITGFCFESAGLPISTGRHNLRLMVGNCPGSTIANGAAGHYSTSRLIVEEIPRPRDPEVNPGFYHPQWQHCAIASITNGELDTGPLPSTSCSFNKTTTDSSIRATFNGNLQLTGCSDCCMRWFITLNGQECTNPAPIEATVSASDVSFLSLHRGSKITGICSGTADGAIDAGAVTAVLNVGPCESFNETFDAFTGTDTPSAITLEELPAPRSPAPTPTPTTNYYPIWTQCVSDTPLNHVRNTTENSTDDEAIQTCSFSKQLAETVLRVTWDGNIALDECDECCMRWFLAIDGEECTDPGPIDGALAQDIDENVYILNRPASIAGVCRGVAKERFGVGAHSVQLKVAPCQDTGDGTTVPERSGTSTGFNSVSRFVVEEIPDGRDDCV